jgi:glycerol-3-phosphate acyltransferase PlsY
VSDATRDALIAAAAVIGAYLAGSIPTGLLFARARGVDIRQVGSGNIGATNVARNLGKRLGVVVLLLDACKGALPVLLVRLLGLEDSIDPFLLTATGFAAIAGHCFPVWLRFHGGKGVATSLGVFLVVDPLVSAIAIGIFAVLYGAFRVASIGSIAAAIAFPVLLWLFGRSDAVVALGIAGAIVVVAKHHGNIARLLRGQENKV